MDNPLRQAHKIVSLDKSLEKLLCNIRHSSNATVKLKTHSVIFQGSSMRIVPARIPLTLLATCLALASSAQSSVTPAQAGARARSIVRRMTLDEKIEQAHGISDDTHFRFVPALPHLGIPELRVTNGPAGAGPTGAGPQPRATALPAPIALAASWDTELSKQYGVIVASEALALGSNLLESPDINIARIPQGGRVFEGYGEDPFLVSRIAVANIEGIQSTGMMANVKHYAANNQETDRNTIDEIVPERALREIYLPAFEASVKQAHVASLMCAYPRVNGAYNCENAPLLRDILRQDWHFDGFVTSDFGAVHSTLPSITAGLDLELPTGKHFGASLKQAIETKQLPESALDDMLVRRFTKMIEMGWFSPQHKPSPIAVAADGALSRNIAEQSMVLLKNEDHILPLNRKQIHTLTLAGPFAVRAMTGGDGSSNVIPFYTIQPADGIHSALDSHARFHLFDGYDLAATVQIAKTTDVAIVMVGDNETEGFDHPIELPAAQTQLIEAVAAVNPHTIVVIKSGSAVLMPWLSKVAAVLEAWYPGEEDGDAVANILFGKTNPSGKLPLTFPQSVDQTLAANPDQFPGNGKSVEYSEGLQVGYRAYQQKAVQPLFPFGFGLSYTTFAFSDLSIAPRDDSSTNVEVRFRITNTGSVPGKEVAQLYLTFPDIAEGNEPPHQLKGFQKISLAPGESKSITLKLDERALSYWSVSSHSWAHANGEFGVSIGNSSANTPLQTSFRLR